MATLSADFTSSYNTGYSVGIAESNSWIHINNDQQRPIYARATYLINASDVTKQQTGQNGIVVADSTSGQVNGNFTTIQVLSTARFNGLSATNSTTAKISSYDIPQGMTIYGPIFSFNLKYGAVLAF